MEAGGRKRKVRVNPGHHQHHRDKAQNSGTVPPIPGRLATPGQGPKFRGCPAHFGTVPPISGRLATMATCVMKMMKTLRKAQVGLVAMVIVGDGTTKVVLGWMRRIWGVWVRKSGSVVHVLVAVG